MGLFNRVKEMKNSLAKEAQGKYSKYKAQKAEEKEIYENELSKQRKLLAKEKARMKVQHLKQRAAEEAKAGGKLQYYAKKAAQGAVKLQKSLNQNYSQNKPRQHKRKTNKKNKSKSLKSNYNARGGKRATVFDF